MKTVAIQTQNLSLSLGGTAILKDLSLTIHQGEHLSILGPNGAGKTSLIKCLAGLYTPQSGSQTLFGKPFSSYSSRQCARLQSYVPQATSQEMTLSVEEFVELGRYPYRSPFTPLTSDDKSAIEEALEHTELTSLRQRSVATLSGGEKQMVFIAAALAQKAPLLLLDEPAAFLDYRHQEQVARILKTAAEKLNHTIIAIHHDIRLATQHSNRVIALKAGKIIFDGTPEELLNPQILQSIYDVPFRLLHDSDTSLPLAFAEEMS